MIDDEAKWLIALAVREARRDERERCAKIVNDLLRPGQLQQQAGEMTAGEMRTAKAVINYIATAINLDKPTETKS